MKEWLKKYRALSFEDRTIFNTRFSVVFNMIMAYGKFILAFFFGIFFFIAGIVNMCLSLSKLQCYWGIRRTDRRSFTYRNRFIGFTIIVAGTQYAIYMARLIFTNTEIMKYNEILAIMIAFVSFVELAIAIKGLFTAAGRGHYYRNIKLINMCSAMTAMVLTMIALLSFASDADNRLLCGISGVSVGALIVVLGVYVLYAPKISVVDKEHNVYKCNDLLKEEDIEIKLTESKFYASYYYKGSMKNGIVDGHIVKGKTPIFNWNIYILILVCVLSEILIFPYAVGAIVYYFKNSTLIYRLDKIMLDSGYEKVVDSND